MQKPETGKYVSIKTKMVLVNLAVTVLISAVTLFLAIVITIQFQKKELINNLELEAKLIAEYSKVAVSFNDPEWGRIVLSKLEKIPDIIEGTIVDEHNNVFARYNRIERKKITENIKPFFEPISVKQPIISDGETIGYVIIKISLDRLFAILKKIILLILVLAVVILFVTLSLSEYIQSRLLLPIQKLANKVNSISLGDWDTSTGAYYKNDEIGTLHREFDNMLSKISSHNKELSSARNYIYAVIDSMPSILIGVDDSLNIVIVNKNAEKEAGHNRNSMISKPLAKLFPEYANYSKQIRKTIKTSKPFMENKIEVQDKNVFAKKINLTIYPLNINDTKQAVIRIEDVTELSRMEDMIIQTEKMMSLGGIAAGMAHEINNPLGIISLSNQNLESKFNPKIAANIKTADEIGLNMSKLGEYITKRKILEFTKSIDDATKKASSIVKNILNFSRKSEKAFSNCDIREVINNTIELVASDFDLKKHYDFKSVEIVKKYGEKIPEIYICETEIEQVLINILKNGAQAMSEVPERKSKFIITLTSDENWVTIAIMDNGPGIPKEIQRRVFEPFYTTKPLGIGTGLGLSVSFMLITQNHDGNLTLSSVPGKGTTFTIQLPKRWNNEQ